METVKLSGLARRVTVLPSTTAVSASLGSERPVVVYRSKAARRKKQSAGLRVVERLMRNGAAARKVYAETYLERHERSNRKRRDGWFRDRRYNKVIARRKAVKRLSRGLRND